MNSIINTTTRDIKIIENCISDNTTLENNTIPLLSNYFNVRNTEENRSKGYFYSGENIYLKGKFIMSLNGKKIKVDIYQNFIIFEQESKLSAICNNGYIFPDNYDLRWFKSQDNKSEDNKNVSRQEDSEDENSEDEDYDSDEESRTNRNRYDSDEDGEYNDNEDYQDDLDEGDVVIKESKHITLPKRTTTHNKKFSSILFRQNNGDFYYYNIDSGITANLEVRNVQGFYEFLQGDYLPSYLNYFCYFKTEQSVWYIKDLKSTPQITTRSCFDDINIPMYYNPTINHLF